MEIKQSVINSFERVGIPYEILLADKTNHTANNRFTGEIVNTSALIRFLILWVYQTNNNYEKGIYDVKVSDFDRIRYFVLAQDPTAYNICLD